MENIKAILFDVDGTLINKDCKMSSNMIKALKILNANGYILGINSGRPVFSSRKILLNNKVDDLFKYYFGYNGNEFFDKKANKTSYVKYLDNQTIKDIASKINEDYITLGMYQNDSELYINRFFSKEAILFDWGNKRFVKPIIYDFSKYEGIAPKLILLFDEKNKNKIDEKIKILKNDSIDIFYSSKEICEIVPVGSNKGLAVNQLANKLNIKEKEILCCGDEENDIPALTKATGLMLGHNDIAKKHNIKYTCASVNDDGLYHFFVKEGLI